METCDSARHDPMTLQTTLKLLSVYQPGATVCTQWNICFVSSLLHVACRLVHLQFDSFGVWEFRLVFIVSYVIYFIDSWWSIQCKNSHSFFQQPQNEDRTRPSKATWNVKSPFEDTEDYLWRYCVHEKNRPRQINFSWCRRKRFIYLNECIMI